MITSALTPINNSTSAASQASVQNEQMRKTAAEFESLLLMQLTSALNSTSDDDGEDKLFGGDGGTGLAKQMFSEQLAQSMAQSGGVGLADLIVNQLSGNTAKSASSKTNKFSDVIAAVKDIKENISNRNINQKDVGSIVKKTVSSFVNKSAKFTPIASEANSSASNDFEVVSTAAEDDAKYRDGAELPKPVMGDEKLFRYYRPRVVPSYMLNKTEPAVETASTSVNASTLSAAATSKTEINSTTFASTQYQLPVHGRITSEFGNRFHPIDRVIKFHHGLDIAAATGTPIAAAADGKVIFAGWSKGYGNTIVIQHADGKQTRYAHAQQLFVNQNDVVTAGQKIAAVGSTGKSTGPHLHFEMLENGQPVNPLDFLP